MRQYPLRCVLRLAAFAVVGACAAQSAGQRAFIAATNETITSDTDVRRGDPPTHVVTVYNRSSVPITVWNVTLSGCENIRGQCGPRRTNLRVVPGGAVMAMRIEPENPRLSFSYRFHFAWRPDSSQRSAAVTALASADPLMSAVLRELLPNDFQAHATRIAKISPRPESLFMAPGERIDVSDVRLLVLDSRDSVMGFTRIYSAAMSPGSALEPGMRVSVARRPGRAYVRYELASVVQEKLASPVPAVDLPIIVAYRFDADAPTLGGRVLDADNKNPLACADIAVEDSAQVTVNRVRTDDQGAFSLKAPRAGTYRVRVDIAGWYPWHSVPFAVAANEAKTEDHHARFSEQLLARRFQLADADYEPARPAAVRFEAGPTRARTASTPVIRSVTLGGSATLPILNIQSPVTPQTLWAQFVVDSAGRADTTTMTLPSGTSAAVRSTVRYVLPRVRFSPARDAGRVTCELIRMQVNMSPQ